MYQVISNIDGRIVDEYLTRGAAYSACNAFNFVYCQGRDAEYEVRFIAAAKNWGDFS